MGGGTGVPRFTSRNFCQDKYTMERDGGSTAAGLISGRGSGKFMEGGREVSGRGVCNF